MSEHQFLSLYLLIQATHFTVLKAHRLAIVSYAISLISYMFAVDIF